MNFEQSHREPTYEEYKELKEKLYSWDENIDEAEKAKDTLIDGFDAMIMSRILTSYMRSLTVEQFVDLFQNIVDKEAGIGYFIRFQQEDAVRTLINALKLYFQEGSTQEIKTLKAKRIIEALQTQNLGNLQKLES